MSYAPHEIDHLRLESWLERAYPTNDVRISTAVPTFLLTAPAPDCYTVNAGMFDAQSAAAIASPSVVPNARARYYGLVAIPLDGPLTRVVRALTRIVPTSTNTLSGPAGAGDAHTWDNDGSYADFYAGHELGHTYGREHPGACEANEDNEYPPAI